MKKLIIILIMFLPLLQLASAAPQDADSTEEAVSDWSGGVEAMATNKYLWRGMEVNKGFILQPAAWLSYQNFTFSLWSSWTLSEPKNDIKRPEVDATLSYELDLDNFIIESYLICFKLLEKLNFYKHNYLIIKRMFQKSQFG